MRCPNAICREIFEVREEAPEVTGATSRQRRSPTRNQRRSRGPSQSAPAAYAAGKAIRGRYHWRDRPVLDFRSGRGTAAAGAGAPGSRGGGPFLATGAARSPQVGGTSPPGGTGPRRRSRPAGSTTRCPGARGAALATAPPPVRKAAAPPIPAADSKPVAPTLAAPVEPPPVRPPKVRKPKETLPPHQAPLPTAPVTQAITPAVPQVPPEPPAHTWQPPPVRRKVAETQELPSVPPSSTTKREKPALPVEEEPARPRQAKHGKAGHSRHGAAGDCRCRCRNLVRPQP